MPFESIAQETYLKHNEPEIYRRWKKETPKGKKPPMHVGKTKEAEQAMAQTLQSMFDQLCKEATRTAKQKAQRAAAKADAAADSARDKAKSTPWYRGRTAMIGAGAVGAAGLAGGAYALHRARSGGEDEKQAMAAESLRLAAGSLLMESINRRLEASLFKEASPDVVKPKPKPKTRAGGVANQKPRKPAPAKSGLSSEMQEVTGPTKPIKTPEPKNQLGPLQMPPAKPAKEPAAAPAAAAEPAAKAEVGPRPDFAAAFPPGSNDPLTPPAAASAPPAAEGAVGTMPAFESSLWHKLRARLAGVGRSAAGGVSSAWGGPQHWANAPIDLDAAMNRQALLGGGVLAGGAGAAAGAGLGGLALARKLMSSPQVPVEQGKAASAAITPPVEQLITFCQRLGMSVEKTLDHLEKRAQIDPGETGAACRHFLQAVQG